MLMVEGEAGCSAIGRVFKDWYPFTSGLLIGFGTMIITYAIWAAPWYADMPSWIIVLAIAGLMTAGWGFGFLSPRRDRRATDMKILGIGFVGLWFMLLLGAFWTPDPNEVGDLANFNPYLCLAIPFALFVAPISFSVFWLGLIRDSLPEARRPRYYLMLLFPILIVGACMMMTAVSGSTIPIILAGLPFGLFWIVQAYMLCRARKKAERMNEFDPRLAAQVKEREQLESLDQMGFRG
jgi:hypothetical protein